MGQEKKEPKNITKKKPEATTISEEQPNHVSLEKGHQSVRKRDIKLVLSTKEG